MHICTHIKWANTSFLHDLPKRWNTSFGRTTNPFVAIACSSNAAGGQNHGVFLFWNVSFSFGLGPCLPNSGSLSHWYSQVLNDDGVYTLDNGVSGGAGPIHLKEMWSILYSENHMGELFLRVYIGVWVVNLETYSSWFNKTFISIHFLNYILVSLQDRSLCAL